MPLQACNCNNKTKPVWSKKSPTQGPNKKEIQQNEWVLFQTYTKAIHEAIKKLSLYLLVTTKIVTFVQQI